MPRESLDINRTIEVLATQVSQFTLTQTQVLMQNHNLLANQIDLINFDWREAANSLNITKTKLYHWYRETFIRNLSDKITQQDMFIIKQAVSKGLSRDDIYESLSREYNNQVFNVAIQNAKKLNKRNLQKRQQIETVTVDQAELKPSLPFMPLLCVKNMNNQSFCTILGSARNAKEEQAHALTLDLESSDFSLHMI